MKWHRSFFRWCRLGLLTLTAALFVGVLWLWMRSYSTTDMVDYNTWMGETGLGLQSVSGSVGFVIWPQRLLHKRPQGAGQEGWWVFRRAQLEPGEPLRPGPTFFDVSGSKLPIVFRLEISYWFLASLLAAYPVVWLLWSWRRTRRRPGYCRKCGYDLRASKDRCPECGSEILNGTNRTLS